MQKNGCPLLPDSPERFSEVFQVSRETLDRLRCYENLLQRWQKTYNLVSSRTLDQIWLRHFADSAQLLSFCPQASRWLDLGTGAGFPGMVIAILLAEGRKNLGKTQTAKAEPAEIQVHLVESNRKKIAFLAQVSRETETPVAIHALRIEQLANQREVPDFCVVSARALSSFPELCRYAQPFLKEKTLAIFPRGKRETENLEIVMRQFGTSCRVEPSLTDPESRILLVQRSPF